MCEVLSKRHKEVPIGTEKRNVVARILVVQERGTHLQLIQTQKGMCWLL